MSKASLELGGTNWAAKDGNLLGYANGSFVDRYVPREFTFSRGSNLAATRVNSAGKIEKGRENLFTQSNAFSTSPWASSVTLTGGQADKDGGTDAWLLTKTASGAQSVYQYINETGVITMSVYAKAGSTNWMRLTHGGKTAYFDLSGSGAVGTTSNGIDQTITSVGNGWFRCTLTANKTVAGQTPIYPYTAEGDSSGSSDSIYIQNTQFEYGLAATDYIETGATTATAGLLENEPRIDYTDGTPSLLLEPQRTNEVINSEYFDAWNKIGSPTITNNYGISPEGLQNSTRLQTTSDRITVSMGTINANETFSIYMKGSGTLRIQVGDENFYPSVTNEWVRYEFKTTQASVVSNIQIRGNGSAIDVELYGAQYERNSYPTSYIPTYGTSVTRNRDTGSLDMITAGVTTGWTSATLFIEYEKPNTGEGVDTFRMHGTSANGRAYIYNTGVGFAADWAIAGGHTLNATTKHIWRLDSLSEGTRFRNGAIENTGSGTAWSDIRYMYLNNQGLGGILKIKQIVLFSTALTDDECIALTTL